MSGKQKAAEAFSYSNMKKTRKALKKEVLKVFEKDSYEARLEMAKKLIEMGLSFSNIVIATGLKPEKIEVLRFKATLIKARRAFNSVAFHFL